jgi:parallel beta-helix repeat protein
LKRKAVNGMIRAFRLTCLLGWIVLFAFASRAEAQFEQWVHCVPLPSQVTLEYRKEGGISYIDTSIELASSGYNVSDWGVPASTANNISINAEIWRWTGVTNPVVTTLSHTYNIGSLTSGQYTFTFKVWLFPVNSTTFTVSIVVPDDYPTIQEAINNANAGDTIHVKAGTYYENVVVNKPVSLIGENKETTTIQGNSRGSTVRVGTDGFNITGFTIANAREYGYNGIGLSGRSAGNISGNRLTNNWYGIVLIGCSRVRIESNIMDNNQYGIAGDACSNIRIAGNTATNNWDGIGIDESSDIEIIGNTLMNNEAYGFVSDFPLNNNHIVRNNITKNLYGISLDFLPNSGATGNSITGNSITDNRYGIDLSYSSNETITCNRIAENWKGISLYASSNNSIYRNNFENNTDQVYSDFSLNIWDDGYPSGGNYWSDYTGVDLHSGSYQNETGSDGIGDSPHIIGENNRDRYPLMNPYWNPADINHDLKIDGKDIAIVAKAYGSYPDHPRWNPIADVNNDNKIDGKDIAPVAKYFGENS